MIPIITYHAIGDFPSPLFTKASVFEAQLAALAEAGYQTVSLTAVINWLNGDQQLPEKSIVLTFDDGYQSVYTEAWPRLKAYGFTATVFLITDYCGQDNQWPGQSASTPKQPLMSWAQAKEMAEEGCEFGAHTCTHQPLPLLTTSQIEAEIAGSQSVVREQTGQSVRIFAQPYGASNAIVDGIVKQHFDGAVSTRLGMVAQRDDPYILARIDAFYWNPSLIPRMQNPLFKLYLNLRQTLRTIRRLVRPDWQSTSITRPSQN